MELTSKRGKRMVLMSEFYVPPEKSLINETVVQPGELITSIFVPAPEPGTRSAYQKYGEKESFDWPIADAGRGPGHGWRALPQGLYRVGRGRAHTNSFKGG